MAVASTLIKEVETERTRLVSLVEQLTDEQATFKPLPEVWSVNEKLEHLVLAETSGVSKIWSAAEGLRKMKPVWVGEHTNRGLLIEDVISRTWKAKEIAPPIATPHISGPLSYWLEYFLLSQDLLRKLGLLLEGLDLQAAVFPHFLCGPLDAGQRIEFLRFHMVRHRKQIESMMADPDFPVA